MSEDDQQSASGREVVAVFGSEQALSDAIDALQSNGIDRARISVLATGTPEAGAKLTAAGFHSVADVLDAERVPRTTYVQPEDVGAAKGLAISGLLYVGGVLGAGLAAAAGPLLAPIVAAAAAGGAAGGSVGAFLTRRLGTERATYIEQSLAHGGLVMWVALGIVGDEERVIALLQQHGGREVHAHTLGDAGAAA